MNRPIALQVIEVMPNTVRVDGIDPTVDCGDCSALCCRLTVVLHPQDNVAAALTTTLANGIAVMARAADGYCVALSTGAHRSCTIYDTRPGDCRRFAMGGAYYRSERSACSR